MTASTGLTRNGGRALPWLMVLALVLYVPGFWWGAPQATAEDRTKAWAVDDETPLGPLAEMSNILHPRPDRNLGYPLLYSFMVVGVQAPYLLYLKASGGLGATSAEYPYGLTEPVGALRMLTWLAHVLTLVMALVVIAAAYDTARVLWGERAAILAALFVTCSYPMFYYSRTGNVDVPMMAFVALAVAAFARIRVHGLSVRRIVALGLFAGAALAVKEEAIGVLLPMALVLVFLPGQFPFDESTVPRSRSKTLAWGLGASAFALGLGGGFFVEPQRYIMHLQFLTGRLRAAPEAGGLIPYAFPYTLDGNLTYAAQLGGYLTDTLTGAGLLLSLAGLIWAVRKHPSSRVVACLLLGYLGFIFVVLRSGQLRYALPAGFLLALFGGYAASLIWESKQVAVRAVVAVLTVVALGLNLLRGIDLTYAMLRDSRWDAAQWLAQRTKPGDHIDYFGASQKLPPLEAGVVTDRATEYRGLFNAHRIDAAKVEEILSRWRSLNPKFVIVMPDHTSRPGAPFDISLPPSLYDDLIAGRRGWKLQATFETPPLLPWVKRPPLDYPMVNPPIRIFGPS
ncbi:MAG TPA: glycosyltransferase family 39 protein [Gemmatimonadales bacterium]|nr:glycosyltransferase family 39 protein [Gemmatimonadales bacterium]